MAKLHQGLFGQFSGKIGNVVGYVVNGKQYARNHVIPKQADSAAANANRIKFSMASRFTSGLKSVLPVLYPACKGTTMRSKALKNILNTGFTGEYPNLSIDYSKVVISAGTSQNMLQTKAGANNSNIKINWHYPKGMGFKEPEYKVILVAYCEAINKCIFTVTKAEQNNGSAALAVPEFKGETVHTWLACTSVDKSNGINCIYTGSFFID
jgi:hypothetical protein